MTIVKKFRILTLSLIFSGALNIGLLAAFIFSVLQTNQVSFSIPLTASSKGVAETTNGQILGAMSKLTFRELVSFLTNRDLVEEGYAKRDLAALVAFHHFNLEKALSTPIAQKRALLLAGGQKVDVFPGLAEDQFEAIIRFAYQEKWPLTAKGLFALLQKWDPAARDQTLEQAFLLTPEFHSLQILFQKTGAPQSSEHLLALARDGNWEFLENFAREQSQALDLSVEKRRRLLLSYLALQSPTAAQMLLQTDFVFILKRLDDQGILDVLSLLKEKTEESERFCVELLQSARSDTILQSAALRLCSYQGEVVSTPLDPKGVLARFVPESPALPAPEKLIPIPSTFKMHVVKDGDTLWKIARQYKVKVDELVSLNELQKDRLVPGMTLRLPSQGTGSEPPR